MRSQSMAFSLAAKREPGEGGGTSVPEELQERIREHGLDMTYVYTNQSGGAAILHDGLNKMLTMVLEIQDQHLRKRCIQLINATPIHLVKTVGAWRRYVYAIIDIIGAWNIKVDKTLSRQRLERCVVDEALEKSKTEPTEPKARRRQGSRSIADPSDPSELKIVRKRQAVLSLVDHAGGDGESSAARPTNRARPKLEKVKKKEEEPDEESAVFGVRTIATGKGYGGAASSSSSSSKAPAPAPAAAAAQERGAKEEQQEQEAQEEQEEQEGQEEREEEQGVGGMEAPVVLFNGEQLSQQSTTEKLRGRLRELQAPIYGTKEVLWQRLVKFERRGAAASRPQVTQEVPTPADPPEPPRRFSMPWQPAQAACPPSSSSSEPPPAQREPKRRRVIDCWDDDEEEGRLGRKERGGGGGRGGSGGGGGGGAETGRQDLQLFLQPPTPLRGKLDRYFVCRPSSRANDASAHRVGAGAAGAAGAGGGGGASSSTSSGAAADGAAGELGQGAPFTPEDPQGFYRVLGVAVDATLRELTVAYRRLALRVHPDKGGAAEQFQRLIGAFEFLSDPERRASYGSGGRAKGGRTCNPATRQEEETIDEQAKTLMAQVLFADQPDVRERIIAAARTEILQNLTRLCRARLGDGTPSRARGRRSSVADGGADADADEGGGAAGAGAGGGRAAGLKWRPKGRDYFVQVAWRGFKMKPSSSVKDHSQAVELHIALSCARHAAMKRFSEHKREVMRFGEPTDAMLDGVVPLSEKEAFGITRADPFTVIQFSSDLRGNGSRRETVWNCDLIKQQRWRCAVRQGLQANKPDAIDALKESWKSEAKVDRRLAMEARYAAWQCVRSELQKRGIQDLPFGNASLAAAPPAPPLADQQVAAQNAVLKLKYEANADELARLNEQLGKAQTVALEAMEERDRAENELVQARQDAAAAQSLLEEAQRQARGAAEVADLEREQREQAEAQIASLQAEVDQKRRHVAMLEAATQKRPRFNLPPPPAFVRSEDPIVSTMRAAQRNMTARDRALLAATEGEPDARRLPRTPAFPWASAGTPASAMDTP